MLPVPFAARPIEGSLLDQAYVTVPPVVGLLKLTEVDWPWQTTRSVIGVTVAVGFTEMVKVRGVPAQVTPPLVKLGVTVMVAVTGAEPPLTAWKDGI